MEKEVVTTFKTVREFLGRKCVEYKEQHTPFLTQGREEKDAEGILSLMSLFFLFLCDTKDPMDQPPLRKLVTNVGTINRWATIVAQRPFADLVTICKTIDNELLRGNAISLGADASDMSILFFGRKFPTKDWRVEGSEQLLNRRYCHERVIFITRMTINLPDDTLQAFVDDYVATDTNLPSFKEMVESDASVVKVSRIFRHHLHGWDPSDHFRPKFGPGAAADAPGLAGKPSSKFLHYGFLTQAQRYAVGKLGLQIPTVNSAKPAELAAHLQFVPKDALKKRSICIEHVTMGYLQQGLSTSLERHLHGKSSWFRFNTRDQNQNRRMLSRRHMVTVDLSSASDTVAWDFVKHSSPTLALLAFYAGRTASVRLPDGTLLHLKKFASMGSTLCFPIETLVFNCIAWVASIESGLSAKAARQTIRVFGDDIVIHECAYERLCQLLTSMGFHVNETKTFTSENPVRETCGWESWEGNLSSPMRISRKYCQDWHDHPIWYASGLAQLANRAFVRGYALLRVFLCSLCREANCVFTTDWSVLSEPDLPWEEPSSAAVFSPDASNSHIRKQFSTKHSRSSKRPDYHRLEYRDFRFRSKSLGLDSESRLEHTLLYSGDREGEYLRFPYVGKETLPETWDLIHLRRGKWGWRPMRF